MCKISIIHFIMLVAILFPFVNSEYLNSTLHQQSQTELMRAAKYAQFNMIHTLLEMGVDPNIVDINGNSALHYLIQNMHKNTNVDKIKMGVQDLLNHGARINIRNLTNHAIGSGLFVSFENYMTNKNLGIVKLQMYHALISIIM
jgi:ankyrin repeat protein